MTALRRIRLDKRMSQGELAQASGISRKQINLIETGKVDPRDATLFRLADALEVDPSVIAGVAAADEAA